MSEKKEQDTLLDSAAALNKIVEALHPLNKEDAMRVIEAAKAFYGLGVGSAWLPGHKPGCRGVTP